MNIKDIPSSENLHNLSEGTELIIGNNYSSKQEYLWHYVNTIKTNWKAIILRKRKGGSEAGGMKTNQG